MAGNAATTGAVDGLPNIARGSTRTMHAPAIAVIDTLAAGDVFHGALALALMEGKPLAPAVRLACAAATLKCGRFGGRLGCPTRAEVEALLAGTA